MPDCTAGSYRLHYQWADGFDSARPTAVFLHDGLGAIGSWRGVPARIGAALGVNALVYDRYGYGRSENRPAFPDAFMEAEVPELLALLDHLGLKRVHLVGHSDGGSIALLCASWHPERVGAVVTEAVHTFVEQETRAGIRHLVALQQQGRTPGWLATLHGERGEHVLRSWSERWLSDTHARWNIRPQLDAVRAPVLAIQGDADEFGTQQQVDSITDRVAGAQSWIVPNAGHTPHSEQEEAFCERVGAFLAQHL